MFHCFLTVIGLKSTVFAPVTWKLFLAAVIYSFGRCNYVWYLLEFCSQKSAAAIIKVFAYFAHFRFLPQGPTAV